MARITIQNRYPCGGQRGRRNKRRQKERGRERKSSLPLLFVPVPEFQLGSPRIRLRFSRRKTFPFGAPVNRRRSAAATGSANEERNRKSCADRGLYTIEQSSEIVSKHGNISHPDPTWSSVPASGRQPDSASVQFIGRSGIT